MTSYETNSLSGRRPDRWINVGPGRISHRSATRAVNSRPGSCSRIDSDSESIPQHRHLFPNQPVEVDEFVMAKMERADFLSHVSGKRVAKNWQLHQEAR